MIVQMVNKASAFIKQGNREKAKQLLVEILKNNPTNEQAWTLLSYCVNSHQQKIFCVI